MRGVRRGARARGAPVLQSVVHRHRTAVWWRVRGSPSPGSSHVDRTAKKKTARTAHGAHCAAGRDLATPSTRSALPTVSVPYCTREWRNKRTEAVLRRRGRPCCVRATVAAVVTRPKKSSVLQQLEASDGGSGHRPTSNSIRRCRLCADRLDLTSSKTITYNLRRPPCDLLELRDIFGSHFPRPR